MNNDQLQQLKIAAPLVAGASYLAWKQLSKSKHDLPLPPGPPGKLIIGNALDIPTVDQGQTYHAMSETYNSDIVHLYALGTHIVVLCSYKAVYEIMEQRSAHTADRIWLPMSHGLMGFEWIQGFIPYNEKWKRLRKSFHPYMRPEAVEKWNPLLLRESHSFLRAVLAQKDNFSVLVRELVASMIMKSMYGITIKGKDDPLVTQHEEALELIGGAAIPGAYLVDIIPALRHVPAWMPGAGFQRIAAHCRELGKSMTEGPMKFVKNAMKNGDSEPSVAAEMLEAGVDEGIVRDLVGGAYIAGTDTSQSTLTTFVLAVLHYPEVQEKAHAELDAVVGRNRLPDFNDRPNLPYINAIVSEAFRWEPVLPLSLPHSTSEDVVYNGYLIPKGTLLFGNALSVLRDPEAYPEPQVFRPERFLIVNPDGSYKPNPNVRDPRVAAFGFGRRICQGRYFGENQVFAAIVSLLHAFKISPALDEQGNPIIPAVKMSSGLTAHPEPYECKFTPRFDGAEELICEAE